MGDRSHHRKRREPLMDVPVTALGTLHVGEMRENGRLSGIYLLNLDQIESQKNKVFPFRFSRGAMLLRGDLTEEKFEMSKKTRFTTNFLAVI
jgi:hypothetical protein